jgi:prevent-host-death family protein
VQANGQMKIASITEAKNNLSALIDGLKAGSPVLIVDRGRPVARLEPVIGSAQDELDGRVVAPAPRRRGTAASQQSTASAVQRSATAPSPRQVGGRCADQGTPGRPVKFWP